MEKWQQRRITMKTAVLTNSVAAITVAFIVITFLLSIPTSLSGNERLLRVLTTSSSSNGGNSRFRSHYSISAVQLKSVSTSHLFIGNRSSRRSSSTDFNRNRKYGENCDTENREGREEEKKEGNGGRIGESKSGDPYRNESEIRKSILHISQSSSFGKLNYENGSEIEAIKRSFLKYKRLPSTLESYLEMEKRFKVYIYSEGELPIVHDGPCKNIYSIEGRFIHEIEHRAERFRTKDPKKAHVYFIPFSVTWMVKYLYKPMTYNVTPLRNFVSDYVSIISTKYSFWNRTQGADHFMLACHDWGPRASEGNSNLYNNSIRVLCNANSSEGFIPEKDVSLPEIHLYDGNISPKLLHPSPLGPSPRPYLAFFAGGLHGPIRPILLQHWRNKTRDPQIQVHEYLPKNLDYYTFMLNSKFCLCPSGYEVASPRIVEAIYAECVPVILSKNYILPFSDVLRWEAFSIKVDVSEIPRLKKILKGVSAEKYQKLVEGVKAVKKHFVLNKPAKRFDVFHMILHSVWLRRLNLKLR